MARASGIAYQSQERILSELAFVVIAKESKIYTFFTAFIVSYVIPKQTNKAAKPQPPKLNDSNPLLTLFGVPDAVGDENTLPFSHMLLMLRTPSAGTGRSEAAGFVGFVVFVPLST